MRGATELDLREAREVGKNGVGLQIAEKRLTDGGEKTPGRRVL